MNLELELTKETFFQSSSRNEEEKEFVFEDKHRIVFVEEDASSDASSEFDIDNYDVEPKEVEENDEEVLINKVGSKKSSSILNYLENRSNVSCQEDGEEFCIEFC